MENLMHFDSPEKNFENVTKSCSNSPGSNPFDTLSKNANLEFVVINDMEYFTKCEKVSGKESLGILKLDCFNNAFNNDYLNLPSEKLIDILNSPLSVSEQESLRQVRYSDITDNSLRLNDAFISDNSKLKTESVNAPEALNIHNRQRRALSLPGSNKADTEIDNSERSLFNETENLDDVFDNSAFEEANSLASKLADGSLVISEKVTSEVLLDCVSPPKLVDSDEKQLPNVNADSVFKKINRLVPIENDLKDSDANCTGTVLSHKAEVKDNLCNIFNNVQKKEPCSSSSSNGSVRDFADILHNLSAIINNDHRDPKLSQEGQQLLSSLANILRSRNGQDNSNQNLIGSGHSSIDLDPDDQNNHSGEALDLRVISKSNDDMQALDLSIKMKRDDNKRLSQSFTLPSSPTLLNKLKTRSTSGSSISTSQLSISKSDCNKLKPKKIDDKSKSMKGPLKAVIPVVDMAKRKSQKLPVTHSTPSRITVAKSSVIKVSRTSTPYNEPTITSTPGEQSSNLHQNRPSLPLRKPKYYFPVSPLVLQNSTGDGSRDLNSTRSSQGSTSTPNLSNQSRKDSVPSSTFMYRRHSASELKTNEKKVPLTRSYSIGAGNKPNIVNKLKKTVSGIATASIKKNVLSPVQKNVSCEKNKKIVKGVKSLSVLGKLRRSKSDKENCPK